MYALLNVKHVLLPFRSSSSANEISCLST